MIAVKLMGGLGNQMFQYALGRKISLTQNVQLALDLTFYNNQADVDTPRSYELGRFNINPKLITKPIADTKPRFSIFSNTPYFPNRHLEKQFPFNPEVLTQPDGTLFQGYWQTEKYFIDIRDKLLNDFTIKDPLSSEDLKIQDRIKAQKSVSLHVRRGDYVNNENANKFHGLKGVEYYEEAIRQMNTINGKYKLFVFSDDIDWCKQNLQNLHSDIYFVDGKRDGIIDMHLMKQCNNNIIANSSFSWWAAWLNNNENKTIIAPKVWFNDNSVDTKDIVPESWIKI
jgi:hypothetical protein